MSIDTGRPDGRTMLVERLALFLYYEARGEAIRTYEAIAASIINRAFRYAEAGLGMSIPFGNGVLHDAVFACLSECEREEHPAVDRTDPMYNVCTRIARRALAGALTDPTGGAIQFHSIGANPLWAQGLTPDAWVGGFLFYSETNG